MRRLKMRREDTSISVVFQPSGRRIELDKETTVLEAARLAGVPIASICGGQGTCGKCKVKTVEGSLSPPSTQEEELLDAHELKLGYRLACQALLLGPATIEVPPIAEKEQYKIALPLAIPEYGIKPNVHKLHLRLPSPSIGDPRPDLMRLKEVLVAEGLEVTGSDLGMLRHLPTALREADWRVTAVLVDGRIAAVEGGDTRGASYGMAFDLGTTTVAAYLMNLDTGRQIAAVAAANRQAAYGEDVMSRIDHAHAGGLEELREAALGTLNQLVNEACGKAGVRRENIYEAVIVGNTCMHHLLLGIDPYHIGVAPFVPALREALDIPARELGLAINEGGNVHLLPVVAGFVGADAVADALAAALEENKRVRLMIDIGTNAEIMLSGKGRLLACAAAAGPAFEGARISCGMRAAPGAIDRVEIAEGGLKAHTIGDRPPLGIAGSGLVSATAALRRRGLLNHQGRFVSDNSFVLGERGMELLLAPAEESGTGQAITISERDIAELILAKAAIGAGTSILLKEMGLAVEDIQEVLVAGAFGNYMDAADAIEIGLVPSLPLERVMGMGNAAGAGAVLALLSLDMRKRAQEIVRRIEYIELSAHPDFNNEFVRVMHI